MLGFSESPGGLIARSDGGEAGVSWSLPPAAARGTRERGSGTAGSTPTTTGATRVRRCSLQSRSNLRSCRASVDVRRVGTLARPVHGDHIHVAGRARHRPRRAAREHVGVRSVDVVVAAAGLLRERPRRARCVAVSYVVNRSKGDRSPDESKPPNHGDWCEYAKAWVAVKARWHLTITGAEKAALASMLFGCPP